MGEGDGSKKKPTHEKKEVALPTPPDGGWGWMVVLASFFNHVIADGVAYSFGVFNVEFLEQFGCSKAEVGWIGSLMIGITWGSGPIASALINRYGCRKVTIAGSLLASFSFIISIFSPNIYVLYITYGIMAGLGLSFIYLPSIVSVTYYFEKKRAFATGLAVCGSGFGTFVFAPLYEILIEEYTWKGASVILAGVMLNCIVFGTLFRPLSETSPPPSDEDEVSSDEDEGIELPGEKRHLKEIKWSVNGIGNGDAVATHAFQSTEKPLSRKVFERSKSREDDPSHFMSLQALDKISAREHVHRFGSEGRLAFKRQRSLSIAEKHHDKGIMYKRDIFYSGSLFNIPAYKKDPSGFTQSMMSFPDADSVDGNQNGCCGPEMNDAFKEMTDFSLLKNPLFLMFGISNFFTSIGFCVPYMFLPDWAIEKGIPESSAAFLISVIGIANTFGRVVFGWISDKEFVNRIVLYGMSMTICGIATVCSAFCNTYALLATYSAVFGVFLGVYVSLTSVVLVDLLGLERLTNSMGLTLVFQGTAAVIGPPLAGWICDLTGSYDYSFYITGIIVVLSGVICFFIPITQRYCQPNTISKHDMEMGKRSHKASIVADDEVEITN